MDGEKEEGSIGEREKLEVFIRIHSVSNGGPHLAGFAQDITTSGDLSSASASSR